MSLRGRFVIDRIKRSVAGYLKLPVPPYQDPNYWEGVYKSLGPSDVFEWGNIACADLLQHSYHNVRYDHPVQMQAYLLGSTPKDLYGIDAERTPSTLGDLLDVHSNGDKDEPVLILGCGNSKFGEDMIASGWRGPLVQVDCSARVTESVSIRCAKYLESGDMLVLQDDATILSALDNGTVSAAFDKGLLDALFCADEYQQMFQVLKSVNRVLTPGATFCALSFSRPEFILPRLLLPPDYASNGRHAQQVLKLWSRVDVRLVNHSIYCYRLTKPAATSISRLPHKNVRSRR
jgi:SAM-dependent methyltransferase